jgi:hypothetical protein
VQSPTEQGMRMTNQRRMRRILSPCIQQSLQPSRRPFKK